MSTLTMEVGKNYILDKSKLPHIEELEGGKTIDLTSYNGQVQSLVNLYKMVPLEQNNATVSSFVDHVKDTITSIFSDPYAVRVVAVENGVPQVKKTSITQGKDMNAYIKKSLEYKEKLKSDPFFVLQEDIRTLIIDQYPALHDHYFEDQDEELQKATQEIDRNRILHHMTLLLTEIQKGTRLHIASHIYNIFAEQANMFGQPLPESVQVLLEDIATKIFLYKNWESYESLLYSDLSELQRVLDPGEDMIYPIDSNSNLGFVYTDLMELRKKIRRKSIKSHEYIQGKFDNIMEDLFDEYDVDRSLYTDYINNVYLSFIQTLSEESPQRLEIEVEEDIHTYNHKIKQIQERKEELIDGEEYEKISDIDIIMEELQKKLKKEKYILSLLQNQNKIVQEAKDIINNPEER